MTSLLAPENTVEVVRGASKTLKLTVTDASNVPINLTGSTLYFTVKSCISSDNIIQKVSTNVSQIALTDPIGGVAEIYLVPGDTKNLDIQDYVFDVWIVLASTNRYEVIPPSTFTVKPSVTVLP